MNAHKVVAYCNPENIESWKVLEKLGLEREGCLMKNAYFPSSLTGEEC
jgi:RimJ/RimL family protein N-acetyltransferase